MPVHPFSMLWLSMAAAVSGACCANRLSCLAAVLGVSFFFACVRYSCHSSQACWNTGFLSPSGIGGGVCGFLLGLVFGEEGGRGVLSVLYCPVLSCRRNVTLRYVTLRNVTPVPCHTFCCCIISLKLLPMQHLYQFAVHLKEGSF